MAVSPTARPTPWTVPVPQKMMMSPGAVVGHTVQTGSSCVPRRVE